MADAVDRIGEEYAKRLATEAMGRSAARVGARLVGEVQRIDAGEVEARIGIRGAIAFRSSIEEVVE